jgi:O-antigen/teichoic acid export membrane protein
MNINEFMLVSFSSLFTVSVALLRIISLSQNEIFNYNLITSSNSIFLALLIFIFPFDEYKKISLLIFVSSIFSAFLASFLVKLSYIDIKNAIVNSFEKTFFGNIRSYFLYNLWSFLPAIAVPLSTNFTYKQLIHGGNDNSFAGYFDISILFLSFALLPLNLIVPILFNYWSKNKSNHNLLITSFNKLCLYGFLFSLIFLLFVVPLCPTIIPIIFGESFGPSIFPTQILLMSLYPNYMIRLYSAAFLSVGFPRTIAFGEISRTMLILCCMRIEQLQFPVGASIVWGLGSIICCFYMYFVFLRKVAV